MQIAVHGAGYVGIPTALALLSESDEVSIDLIDPSEKRRKEIADVVASSEADPDLLGEPGLGRSLRDAVRHQRLTCSEFSGPVPDLHVCCVGTPYDGTTFGSGDFDYTAVSAVASVACMDRVPLVVRSTVSPVWVRDVLRPAMGDVPFAIVPEFLAEGTALRDALNPSRVVIGPSTLSLGATMEWLLPAAPVHILTPEEAATVKLASNALLYERVMFGSRLAQLLQPMPGADVRRVAGAIGADPRIGTGHLLPGLGPAGPCLPKDYSVWTSVAAPPYRWAERWSAVDSVANIVQDLPGSVMIWGAGFKPTSRDYRDSPVWYLERALRSRTPLVVVDTAHGDVLERPGVLVLCTRFDLARALGTSPSVVVDPYALLRAEEVRDLAEREIRYQGAGRGPGWETRS